MIRHSPPPPVIYFGAPAFNSAGRWFQPVPGIYGGQLQRHVSTIRPQAFDCSNRPDRLVRRATHVIPRYPPPGDSWVVSPGTNATEPPVRTNHAKAPVNVKRFLPDKFDDGFDYPQYRNTREPPRTPHRRRWCRSNARDRPAWGPSVFENFTFDWRLHSPTPSAQGYPIPRRVASTTDVPWGQTSTKIKDPVVQS